MRSNFIALVMVVLMVVCSVGVVGIVTNQGFHPITQVAMDSTGTTEWVGTQLCGAGMALRGLAAGVPTCISVGGVATAIALSPVPLQCVLPQVASGISSNGNAVCVTPSAGGITGATSGGGLLVTGTTLGINAGGVISAMIADGTVASADVGFNYAGSSSKSGPAGDIGCIDCVALASETAGNYVASVSGGTGISVSGSGSESAGVQIALPGIATCDGDDYITWTGTAWTCRQDIGAGGGVGDMTSVGSVVSGDAFASAAASGQWLGLGTTAGRIAFSDQAIDYVNILNANVGIGTSTPGVPLDVVGNIRSSGQLISTVAFGTAPLSVISSTVVPNLNADKLDNLDATSFASSTHAHANVVTDNTQVQTIDTGADGSVMISAEGKDRFKVYSDGKARYCAGSDPSACWAAAPTGLGGLYIRGGAMSGALLKVENTDASSLEAVVYHGSLSVQSGGNIYVPSGGICVDSDTTCGTLPSPGQIRAVSYFTGNSDVAENYKSSQKLEPGDVVEIDSANAKGIKLSSSSYNTKVAGIISEKPGLTLGEKDNKQADEYPLALSGRVYVKVTNENGAILPGDLLTTSSTTGAAMKCDDKIKCYGAIIGKALEPFNAKNGKIEVLVTLS